LSGARYTSVAIVLHWAIAAAIVGNFALGLWMHEAIDEAQNRARIIDAYQLHKSIGLSILILSLFRLAWRLLHRPPPFPAGMPRWQKTVASTTHWLFYALMIAIPLSGWLYVSTQWRDGAPLNVPTLWFGLFEIPHLFGLDEAGLETRQTLAALTGESHEILAFGTMALLVLHVGAALKHHFVNRDETLERMLPLPASTEDRGTARGRRWIIFGGSLLIVLAVAAALASLFMPSRDSSRTEGVQIRSTADGWLVDPDNSEIAFSGEHAGKTFRGHFTRWRADLQLRPDDPTASHIGATIHTGSATDGVRLHDRTLPEAEWFDVANHPTASFQATAITPNGENQFRIAGVLEIKNNAIEVPNLVLTLQPDQATITGQLIIDRADADLGMESDPRGEWVSRRIEVEVMVTAVPREAPKT